jgi:hypothetical protein
MDQQQNQSAVPEDRNPCEDIVVFCDESGAKGYADQSEKEPGDFGVFAGFPVPRSVLKRLTDELKHGLSFFRDGPGKIHVTDLPPERQEALRQSIFRILAAHEIWSFYEAIYVEGFHTDYLRLRKVAEDAARRAGSTRVKYPTPELLHVHLFQGFYGSILAFCARMKIKEVSVEIRTDRIDGPILKRFHTAAINLLVDIREYELKRWDPETKTVRKGKLTLKFNGTPAPLAVTDCLIQPVEEDSDLVLAADVLANSVRYHLRCRAEDRKFGPLNIREAIQSHPLAPLFMVRQTPNVFDFSDSMFAHPLRPKH